MERGQGKWMKMGRRWDEDGVGRRKGCVVLILGGDIYSAHHVATTATTATNRQQRNFFLSVMLFSDAYSAGVLHFSRMLFELLPMVLNLRFASSIQNTWHRSALS
jgi:hypothetical protein